MPNKRFSSLLIILSLFFIFFIKVGTTNAQVDNTRPVTTIEISPSTPNGNNGWYITPVQVTLTATDLESGVKEIYYKLDSFSWQMVSFENTLNLAQNPSFEDTDATTGTGLSKWRPTVTDADTVYSQDTLNSYTGFESSSAKIETTGNGWHGINNTQDFAVTAPFSNMNASVWVKTENVVNSTYFKVYAISNDINGDPVYTEIGQSPAVSGTNDWTQLSLDFIVSVADAYGVYIDLGIEDSGTVWFDAVSITESTFNTAVSFFVSLDGAHTLEYYAIDRAGNAESSSCPANKNCALFDIDQTPPGNWRDSGAVRGVGGGSNADHELYVFVTVEDPASGLSSSTSRYQYNTEVEPGYGYFSNLLGCNSTWNEDQWTSLLDYPTVEGTPNYELRTPKTDLCNNNWRLCKTIRFYSEDVAGNVNSKDFCINGPWVRVSGGGIVRANQNIDMIAEPEDDNTDGMIEAGSDYINFFTSTYGWRVLNSPEPNNYYYEDLYRLVPNVVTVTDISTSSGVYLIDGNYTLDNQSIPNTYDNSTFDQIVFINGDLTIDNDITIRDASTALYIVKGNVYISELVKDVFIGIVADGDINTAYDNVEGSSTSTLTLRGTYVANKINFQRTLQGTNNSKSPSEDLIYEPKYLVNLRQFIGEDEVIWLPSE
jgi:hypothetical protein